MNIKKQNNQNNLQQSLWQIPDSKNYGLGYLFLLITILGVIYLTLFSDISQLVFYKSYVGDPFWKTFKNSFKDLLLLKGDYWMMIKVLFGFSGIIGFFLKSGNLITKLIMKDYKKVFFECSYIYIPIVLSIGAFCASFIWLVLGVLGFLNVKISATFFIFGFICFVDEVRKFNFNHAIVKGFRLFSRIEQFMFIVLLLWIFSWTVRAFLDEFFLDSLVYQLGLPWNYILEGKILTNPYNSFSYMGQNMEMLFLPALLLKLEPITKLLSWFFWCCMLSVIYGYLTLFSNRFFSLIAAMIFAFFPMTFWQACIAKNDNLLGLYVLLGSILCVQFLVYLKQSSKSINLLFLSGVFIGCAIGTKYVGIVSAVHLFIFIFLISILEKTTLSENIKNMLIFFIGVVCSFFPWAIRSLWVTGNPIYPYMHVIFSSDLIRFWHQGLNTESGLSLGLNGYSVFFQNLIGLRFSDYARLMGTLGMFIIFLPVAIFIKNKPLKILSVCFFSGWFFVSLFTLTTRYQIGYAALLVILIVSVLFYFFQKNSIVQIILLFLVLGGLYHNITRNIWMNEVFHNIKMATMGIVNQQEYMSGDPALVQRLNIIYSKLDEIFPKEAKILLVAENRIYKLPRKFIASSFIDEQYLYDIGIKLNSSEEIKNKVVEDGITHVIVNNEEWKNYLENKQDINLAKKLNEFFKDKLEILGSSSDKKYLLFEVKR